VLVKLDKINAVLAHLWTQMPTSHIVILYRQFDKYWFSHH